MADITLERIQFDYPPMRMTYDLTIASGAMVTVTGPSGAGKSTLLNLIAGFDLPITGRILIGGTDVTGATPGGRPVTTLFQDHNLFGHLSVARNVALGRHPGLRLSAPDWRDVDAALGHVGLDGFGDRRPGSLSGGERQRVALARSLVRRRPVLLLDEPFAALGPGQRREMIDLVERVRRETAMTVVMVTHQIDDLRHIDGRCLFVDDGRIVADCNIPAMLAGANNPSVARYLGLSDASAISG